MLHILHRRFRRRRYWIAVATSEAMDPPNIGDFDVGKRSRGGGGCDWLVVLSESLSVTLLSTEYFLPSLMHYYHA